MTDPATPAPRSGSGPPARADAVPAATDREGEPDALCLVTGASGFIGGRLSERLLGAGHRVRCLVRDSSDTSRLERLDVELTRGELGDPDSLARAVLGATHVFHCAALVSDWATVTEIRRTNVQGTAGLLAAACDARVERFIHLSTTDVYSHPGRAAVPESFRAETFGNWYAQSKREAEAEVARAARTQALETVILRPATVYGPGSVDVIGEIARAICTRQMLLIGRGRSLAGLCFIDNLIDAALLALGHPAAAGLAFNVSDGVDISWRELCGDLAEGLGAPAVRFSLPYPPAAMLGLLLEQGYRLLRRTTGLTIPPLLSRQAVQVLGREQNFDTTRITQVLGWEPRIDYRDGLQATLAWLREEHLPGRSG